MASRAESMRLGPFAPDTGPPISLARAAWWLGVAAAVPAAYRPIAEAMGPEAAWARVPALGLAAVGIVVALAAVYRVSTRGLRGRGLALGGLALSIGAALGAVLYAAVDDGTLRLDRFIDQYFNVELLRAVAPDLWRGAINTVRVTFVAQVFAIVAGLVLATFTLSPRRLLRWPAVVYVDVVRGLPIVVLAFLVVFGLPFIGISLGTFAQVGLTLTINASAYIAEIFRAGIQALPRGQMDAARSLGMTHGAAMISVVIPQAVRAVIPPLMNEFIALIKDSALIWFVAGFTVATRDLFGAAQQGSSSTFSPTPLVGGAIGYLMITIPLSRMVGRVERRLRTGLA